MNVVGTTVCQKAIQKAMVALSDVIKQYIAKNIELERVARVATLLIRSGLNVNNSLFFELRNKCKELRKEDSGWNDVEETVWVLSFLRHFGEEKTVIDEGIQWLNRQKHTNGSWGNTQRDIGRIPLTGLLVYLHPEISTKETISWLENELTRGKESFPMLTYKGAFFLLGMKASAVKADNCFLIKETYSFLANEQNDVGGFGPWKDHPVGSEPWSTGIVLLGLLSYPELVKKEVIENAVSWLVENQIPNGLWPYHYIEEGSVWALYALIESCKYLKKC